MKPRALIIHHSAGLTGSRAVIDRMHRNRKPPFRMIGYHKVICNGIPTSRSEYKREWDGRIQQGRADNERGAQCPTWNDRSLGICLVGHFEQHTPTPRQWTALVDACVRLCERHGLTAEDIYGHGEVRATKCPGFLLPMDGLRRQVEERLNA